MTKDIPITNLSLQYLIRECNNGIKTNEEIFNDISRMNSEVVHDVFKYRKFCDDFVDTITLYSSDDEELGKFRPCYYDFTTKLVRFLDCHYMKDDEELTRLLNEKVDQLSKIPEESENDRNSKDNRVRQYEETRLKNQFKLLFDDLLNGRAYLDALEKSNIDKNSDEYKEKEKYFYRCGLKRNIVEFIKSQTELYRRFVNKRWEYGRKTLEIDFNDYMNKYFDMNKVETIVMDKILKNCESTNDYRYINMFKPLLSKYINKPNHANAHDENGKQIDISNIDYRAITTMHRALKLEEENNIYINKQLVKEGSNNTIKRKEPARQLSISPKNIGNLKNIESKKLDFYANHPPYINIIGDTSLKGYDKARLYENGEVILDTEYKDKPKGAAIYNFKIEDYDELNGLTPSELKQHEKVTWIPHRPGWEEELEKIINREATEEDKKNVEEFIEEHKKR